MTKSKEYFSVVRRALMSGGGVASFVRIILVKSSDFVQETQLNAGIDGVNIIHTLKVALLTKCTIIVEKKEN